MFFAKCGCCDCGCCGCESRQWELAIWKLTSWELAICQPGRLANLAAWRPRQPGTRHTEPDLENLPTWPNLARPPTWPTWHIHQPGNLAAGPTCKCQPKSLLSPMVCQRRLQQPSKDENQQTPGWRKYAGLGRPGWHQVGISRLGCQVGESNLENDAGLAFDYPV